MILEEKIKKVKGYVTTLPYEPPTHMVEQDEFTIVAPIPAEQKDELNQLLDTIGRTLKDHQYIDFRKLPTVHYCRFFIIDQAKNTDGTLLPPLLTFSIIYDGKTDALLEDFLQVAGKTTSNIFGYISGYPANESISTQIKFLKKYRHPEKLFWAAIRGGTVEQILQEAKLANHIQQYLDTIQAKPEYNKLESEVVYSQIKASLMAGKEFQWALDPEPSPTLAWKVKYYGRRIFTNLMLISLLPLWLPLAIIWIGIAKMLESIDNRRYKPVRTKPLTDVLEYEDRVFQNQLTIYGTLKKPSWFRVNNLRLFLAISQFRTRYKATKGNLGGIETIHFVSWVSFNKGKNVMFLSNYDGGWESYLSEFIDQAASIMNLSFGNLQGYPPTRWFLKDGAHDEQAFKSIVRDNQYPCPVWYSAYPLLTVKNILKNSRIRQGLSANLNAKEIEEWFKLF
jgi:hypothetical protein